MLSGEKKKDNKFPVCKISTCLLFADIVMSNLWIVTQVMNSCIEGEKERGKREKEASGAGGWPRRGRGGVSPSSHLLVERSGVWGGAHREQG